MERLLQTLKLSLKALVWLRAGLILFLAAASCASGWYAWSSGQAGYWILFCGLLVLLLTVLCLWSRLATRLLKSGSKQVVHTQTELLHDVLEKGLVQGERLVETEGKVVGMELNKLADRAVKELDLAVDGLKRDFESPPAQPVSKVRTPPASKVVCPSCGQPLRSTSQFCDRCGASIVRRCPRCGRPARSAAAHFCDECGASLKN